MQNNEAKFKPALKRHKHFSLFAFRFSLGEEGTALLLVVVILSALISISIGIFNIVFGQIKISGEISDSFYAFYAADQGIERILYRDRIQEAFQAFNCTVTPVNGQCTEEKTVPSQACYIVIVSKAAGNTDLVTSGQYRCGASPSRTVKRGFQVGY